MIITGNSNNSILSCESNVIILSDVNSKNINDVRDIYNKASLYIDYKLENPVIGYKITDTILDNTINNRKNSWKTKFNMNDTQVNNLCIKLNYWITTKFKDIISNTKNAIILVDGTPSKHEQIFFELLSSIDIKVIIITDKINDILIDCDKHDYKTNEHLDYKCNNSLEVINNKNKTEIQLAKDIKSISDIETALYKNNEIVKVFVCGISDYLDTCNFYAKLNNKCSNNEDWVLIKNGFEKPAYEDTSKLPRFSNTNHDYIVHTLLKFVNAQYNGILDIIKNKFDSSEYANISGQILYNKLASVICTLNKLYEKHTSLSHIVYYGEVKANDKLILDILNKVKELSIIVACSDKSKYIDIDDMNKLDLDESTDIFEIPVHDKREDASTMAAQAENIVNKTLFSGDTLGMYKPGQFRTCDVVNFNTTFDEIKLWWNKELYLRPGFEAHGSKAIIPTIFRVVKGCNSDSSKYLSEIQKYCCGKTILCKGKSELDSLVSIGEHCNIHRGTDINHTRFEDQKPFFENDKLNKDRIKSGKNYQYRFLDVNKQDLILDKIEDILTNNKINKKLFSSEQEFIDTVLNIGLNLHTVILQNIQWFEFYTYNPNLVLVLKDQNIPDINNMILLALLQNLGFDILIFVPTSYSSIEGYIGNKFIYDTNIVGEANYDINIDRLHVTSNIEINETNTNEQSKKQGFFSKIFNR